MFIGKFLRGNVLFIVILWKVIFKVKYFFRFFNILINVFGEFGRGSKFFLN